jgi:hypothetical protein
VRASRGFVDRGVALAPLGLLALAAALAAAAILALRRQARPGA